MPRLIKKYVIRNNIGKYVNDVSTMANKGLRYSWTEDPNKAKVFDEYPDYPSNSRVHEVLLKSFYHMSLDGDKPVISESKPKPFLANKEFRSKRECVETYLSEGKKTLIETEAFLKKLKSNLEYTENVLIKDIIDDVDNKKDLYTQFKNLCVGKIIKFTIFSWGQRYIHVLGRATEEEGNQVVFYNSAGDKMLSVDKNTVGYIENGEGPDFYNIYVDPKYEQSYTIKLVLNTR